MQGIQSGQIFMGILLYSPKGMRSPSPSPLPQWGEGRVRGLWKEF